MNFLEAVVLGIIQGLSEYLQSAAPGINSCR
jgi:undecaprenyl pyrophosphate phosphatase UppP